MSDRERQDIGQGTRGPRDIDDPGVIPDGVPPDQKVSELSVTEKKDLCVDVINTRADFERSVKFRRIQADLLALIELINDDSGNSGRCQERADFWFDEINTELESVNECPLNIQKLFSNCDISLREINDCLIAKEVQVENVYGIYTCDNFEEAIRTIEDALSAEVEPTLPEACLVVENQCPWIITAYD